MNRHFFSFQVISGVGDHPLGIAFNPVNKDMYVANEVSNTVSVIDSSTNTVISTISFGSNSAPVDIAFNPTNNDMYVTDVGLGDVSVIELSSKINLTT
ncbi:MAG TPA: hypothetical protein VE971_04635 [Candidatus Eisenbacteria bacterium]|nr:hypothetical protein [Candidatus Eisenbacteria bacterium]